jgi:hypothetical protein
MKWVTRENAAVDRIACPWLIRRFVDPSAKFLFVPPSEVAEVADRQGAIPFDVAGVQLGHRDGRCSFESIVLEYGLMGDAALVEVARVVHGADIQDEHSASESPGLRAIASGFRMLHGADDRRKLELQTPLYDALYAWAAQKHADGRPAGVSANAP